MKREREQSRKNTFEGKMDMFLNLVSRKPIYGSKKLGEAHTGETLTKKNTRRHFIVKMQKNQR